MSENREIILLHNYTHQSSKIHTYLRRALRPDTIFGKSNHFQNDKKCFLFHLKSSFRSQDFDIGHV